MKKFKSGQAIVFLPRWAKNRTVHKNHPIKYGAIVHFLAYHSPAYGHCIVVDYKGKITTMLHPEDFRLATDEEV